MKEDLQYIGEDDFKSCGFKPFQLKKLSQRLLKDFGV
jgi:hypothetical protein